MIPGGLGPLLQTALWVALIVGLVWRFNPALSGILVAIQKRIESGSGVKLPWLEISEMQTQSAEQQAEKTESEVSEILETQQTDPQMASRSEITRQIREVEDLALRALQVRFGVPIARQVSLGRDFLADGTFTKDGVLHVVEVKYAAKPAFINTLERTLSRTVDMFQHALDIDGVKNVRLVLAVVVGFSLEDDSIQSRVGSVLKTQGRLSGLVQVFSLEKLRAQFGSKTS